MAGKSNSLRLSQEQRYQSSFQRLGNIILKYLQDDLENPEHKLMYYQRDAVLAIKKRFDQDADEAKTASVKRDWLSKVALIVAPTGSGKSGIVVLLPYALEARRVLVLTPSKIISSQLAHNFGILSEEGKTFFETSGMSIPPEDLQDFMPVGYLVDNSKYVLDNNYRVNDLIIINAQKFGGKSRITLNTRYQGKWESKTVANVKKFFESFDLLIVDEAHHFPAPTWERIVKEFMLPVANMDKKIVFLTATPYRDAGKTFILGSGDYAKSRIAYNIKEEETIRGKATRPCVFKELNEVGDLVKHFRSILLSQETLFKPQAMILVTRITEAQTLAVNLNEKFQDPFFAIALTSKSKSPKEDEQAFTSGTYRVAVVCGKLLEGYDNPHVTVCVFLRNVRSPILFDQFIGRALRTKRYLNGQVDETTAVVLAYKKYNLKSLWDRRELLAVEDPFEVDLSIEEDGPAVWSEDWGMKTNLSKGYLQDKDLTKAGMFSKAKRAKMVDEMSLLDELFP